MNRLLPLKHFVLAMGGATALTALLAAQPNISPASTRAHAGFSQEELAGFELTEIIGTVTTVLPEQKVLEVIDPEGHSQILTVGSDLAPLNLKAGDQVVVRILDGLIVDLQTSTNTDLSFNREDIILPMPMGQLPKGMRVALASGTARVIELDKGDRSISLLGPLGGIHNLDFLEQPTTDIWGSLKIGDSVDFRLIQPVALNVRKLSAREAAWASETWSQSGPAKVIQPGTSLKAELEQSFEISHIAGDVVKWLADDSVLELKAPEGFTMTVNVAHNLIGSTAINPGDRVSVDLLQGLIVDLQPSPRAEPRLERVIRTLDQSFGAVPAQTSITMLSGTAEVVRLSRKDNTISLRGPLGRVHNLDVRKGIDPATLSNLEVGNLVEFRLIQPVVVKLTKLD